VPRSVKIELTARCDFQCFFCASSMRLRDKADIDPALFRRLLKEMRGLGIEEIGLFYLGESFLCRWLPEAIAYAKRECGYPYVFLTTNGRMATPERVRECIEAGLDSLGDLGCETFLEAWHSGRFQRLRRANLAEDVRGTACEKCIAYE
jgi:MoaA/NifB/PqqE/SkfB family radical SAM enzyme